MVDALGNPFKSPQERCNEVWRRICRERGLDFDTIQPTEPPNPRAFLAQYLTEEGEQDETVQEEGKH